MFGLTLLTIARRSAWLGAALGLVSGVADPLQRAAACSCRSSSPLFVALARRRLGRCGRGARSLALVAISPWVIRNKVELGCITITTDGRALWKANNVNTYTTLSHGLWLDQVPGSAASGS